MQQVPEIRVYQNTWRHTLHKAVTLDKLLNHIGTGNDMELIATKITRSAT
jgi:hypothetical protein